MKKGVDVDTDLINLSNFLPEAWSTGRISSVNFELEEKVKKQ